MLLGINTSTNKIVCHYTLNSSDEWSWASHRLATRKEFDYIVQGSCREPEQKIKQENAAKFEVFRAKIRQMEARGMVFDPDLVQKIADNVADKKKHYI